MTDQTLISKLQAKKAPSKAAGFPAMLETFKAEIARALPRHLSADRMVRIALTAFRRTPKLAECDPRSVFAAVIQASQLGLEPDTLGRAYLIPYGRECQFVPGWKGLVELMNRSGNGAVWTGAVYSGDAFDFQLGDSPRIRHVPAGEYSEDALTHVYAVGRLKGCEWSVIEVWPISRVLAHRDRYNKVGRRHYSYENLEMYARKVVLLQILKYMPLSADLQTTMELLHAADSGAQGLTIEGAVEGTWTPPAQEDGSSDHQPPVLYDRPFPAEPPQAPGHSQAPNSAPPEAISPIEPLQADRDWVSEIQACQSDAEVVSWWTRTAKERSKLPAETSAMVDRAVSAHRRALREQESSSAPQHLTWPSLGDDGFWRDSSGALYSADHHGWNAGANRPSVTSQGVFRAKRGAAQVPTGGTGVAIAASPAIDSPPGLGAPEISEEAW